MDGQRLQCPGIGLPVKGTTNSLCPIEWHRLLPKPL